MGSHIPREIPCTHPLYERWKAMHRRCYSPADKRFHRYGGRGIEVCAEWHDFIPFAKWALAHGFSVELQLDRINNDGPYSPDNCRFVTGEVNMQNGSQVHLLEVFGEVKSMAGWARDPHCSVSETTIRRRLRRGLSVEEAIR